MGGSLPASCQGHLCPVPAVESLRHLILWSLRPSQHADTQPAGEPEDDLTPTPSIISVTSHPWDPGSPGQPPTGEDGDRTRLTGPELQDMGGCSLEHLPPRTRNSGIWESPELDRKAEGETTSTEAMGSYKVVRKGTGPGLQNSPTLLGGEGLLAAASFPITGNQEREVASDPGLGAGWDLALVMFLLLFTGLLAL